MTKRVTVIIDDEVDKRLRIKQAKEIKQTRGSVSFSKVINSTLKIGLEKSGG